MFKNNKKIAKLLCSFLATTMVIPLAFSQNNVYATSSWVSEEHNTISSPEVAEKVNNTDKTSYPLFNVYKPKNATNETNMCVVYAGIIAENIWKNYSLKLLNPSTNEENEDSKNRINILIDSDVNSSINKLYKERHCKKQDLINQLLRFAVAEIDSLEDSNK